MTPSELVVIGMALEALKKPEAKARQAHGGTAPGRPKNASVPENRSVSPDLAAEIEAGRTDVLVSKALGVRRRASLSVRMDDDLAADLATMARAGLNASDAVRVALGIVAGTYANAWAAGALPEGMRPEITECVIRPYDGPPAV